ncbi:MAG: triose-phosphate isomerase family protein [bacterium]
MLIIANWKLNLTFDEVKDWVMTYNTFSSTYTFNRVKPVVCPSFIYIPYLKEHLLKTKLGAQNTSHFAKGKYTGEVSAYQLKNFVSFSLIGHSERRENFHETDENIVEKVSLCKNEGIVPIICVNKIEQVSPLKNFDNIFIAYEPLSAIGSKNPDSPSHIEEMTHEILKRAPKAKILYGGSVSEENIKHFSCLKNIQGFLIASESLNPHSFINILKKCDI